jgi:hypothetical protein
MIFVGIDIIVQILNYLDNITDLISIKSTCSLLYNIKHTIDFIETKTYRNIITPYVTLKKTDKLKYNLSYITKLDVRNLGRVRFKNLDNLKYLSCDYVYSGSIEKCNELEGLYCTGPQNHLHNSSLSHLKKIKYLYCTSSRFTDELLYFLIYIQELQISHSSKFTINGYKQLPYLQHLDTQKLRLLTPEILQIVPSIKVLYCSSHINFNDRDISNCKLLQELYDSHTCSFTNTSITNLTHLKILDVRHQMFVFDESLQHLVNLEVLYCPEMMNGSSLLHMPKLKKLYCGLNDIINDDIIIHLNLECLECIYNPSITDRSISTQINLEHLECNQVITENCIKKLNKLKILNMGFNYTFTRNFVIDNSPRIKFYVIHRNSNEFVDMYLMMKSLWYSNKISINTIYL